MILVLLLYMPNNLRRCVLLCVEYYKLKLSHFLFTHSPGHSVTQSISDEEDRELLTDHVYLLCTIIIQELAKVNNHEHGACCDSVRLIRQRRFASLLKKIGKFPLKFIGGI